MYEFLGFYRGLPDPVRDLWPIIRVDDIDGRFPDEIRRVIGTKEPGCGIVDKDNNPVLVDRDPVK